MGCFKMSTGDSYSGPPNPDPNNFTGLILDSQGDYTLVRVHYPGCTNFEGQKLLVLRETPEQLQKRTKLDPHFTEGGALMARFVPTETGERRARAFMKILVEESFESH